MTGRGRTIMVGAVTALACVLLWWGANAGEPLLTPPSSTLELQARTAATPPDVADPTAPPEQTAQEEPQGERDLTWLVYVALVALAVLVALVVQALLRPTPTDSTPTPDFPDELDLLVQATSPDARSAALAAGDPRNAVVACWVALEDGVDRAGLERSPAETSEDLTRRVLGRWQVDETAISRLADLYREARFSRHPVAETDRDTAVAALDRINADLRAAVRAREEAAAAEAVAHEQDDVRPQEKEA